MSTEDIPMRTIEVVFTDHARRLTIPATWKVTFGAIVPSEKAASAGTNGWGLRIYEAQDKQRAVFTGVQNFYDIGILQQVHAIRKYGTEDWYEDDGSWTDERADLVEFKWVDADNTKPGKPSYYEEGLKTTEDDPDKWARAVRATRRVGVKPSF
jgi:hypothetical protein